VAPGATRSLSLPIVGQFFAGFHAGVAGLILVSSGFFSGWRMGLFAIPAAAIAWLGPALGVPGIEALGGPHASSIAMGLAVAFAGVLFGRMKSE
jgi:hypothetical protein